MAVPVNSGLVERGLEALRASAQRLYEPRSFPWLLALPAKPGPSDLRIPRTSSGTQLTCRPSLSVRYSATSAGRVPVQGWVRGYVPGWVGTGGVPGRCVPWLVTPLAGVSPLAEGSPLAESPLAEGSLLAESPSWLRVPGCLAESPRLPG